MEWKYKSVFLMILLCLICSIKTFSQQCLYFKYDRTGNRVESYEGDCGSEYKDQSRKVIDDEEISINEDQQELTVYPNPNNGTFKIDVDDSELSQLVYQIYNNKGVLIKADYYLDEKGVDISDKPAGVYLLRIIKGECVYSKVVVKL